MTNEAEAANDILLMMLALCNRQRRRLVQMIANSPAQFRRLHQACQSGNLASYRCRMSRR